MTGINVVMKLHLPAKLRLAVLACLAATAFSTSAYAAVPSGYRTITISNAGQLASYTDTDYAAFLTGANITDSSYRICGDHQYWSGTTANTRALTFSSFDSETRGVLCVENDLTMEKFKDLTFDLNVSHTGSNWDYIGSQGGAAVCGNYSSSLVFRDNTAVTFSRNTAEWDGGAVCGGSVDFSGNGTLTFSENSASCGGALYSGWYPLDDVPIPAGISIGGNDVVDFTGNSARMGGAIFEDGAQALSIVGNGSVNFEGNRSDELGGAIAMYNYTGREVDVMVGGNDQVSFTGNVAGGNGGCIYHSDGLIALSKNRTLSFAGNSAAGNGGALFGPDIAITGNGGVVFTGNASPGTATVSDVITLNDFRKAKKEFHIDALGHIRIVSEFNLPEAAGANEDTVYTTGYAEFFGATYECNFVYRTDELYHQTGMPTMSWLWISFQNLVGITDPNVLAAYGLDPQGTGMAGGAVQMQFNFTTHEVEVLTSTQGTVTINYPDPMGEYLTFNAWLRSVLNGNFYVTKHGASVYLAGYGDLVNNGGGAVYVTESGSLIVEDNDTVEFSNNAAANDGGAIFGESGSMISISGNTSVTFIQNTAGNYGGAIAVYDNGVVSVADNGSVVFSGNDAAQNGGAVVSYGSLSLSNNGSVTFSENNASSYGGALELSHAFTVSSNDVVEFRNNAASQGGGALMAWASTTIDITDNGRVGFVGNSADTANTGGGAIYAYASTLNLAGNESVEFCGNSVSTRGGAIYCKDGDYGEGSAKVSLCGNDTVEFSENAAQQSGGAIYGADIAISNNGSVVFSGNSVPLSSLDYQLAYTHGGALCGASVSLSHNDTITFSGNTGSYGGAVHAEDMLDVTDNGRVSFIGNSGNFGGALQICEQLTLVDNGTVSFSENKAEYNGGAIDGEAVGTIMLRGNGDVIFELDSSGAHGGAVCADGELDVSNNSTVSFVENSAAENGGALNGYMNSRHIFSDNGALSFVQNYAAACGGAIHENSGASIALKNNAAVEFTGNIAGKNGGAVYSPDIAISNNGSVVFSGNSAAGEQHNDFAVTLNDFRKGKKEFHIDALGHIRIVSEQNLPEAAGANEDTVYTTGYAEFFGAEYECNYMYRTDELNHASGNPSMAWLWISFQNLVAITDPNVLAAYGLDPQGTGMAGGAVELQFNFTTHEAQVLSSSQGTVTINYPDPMGEYITFNAWLRSVLNGNFYVTKKNASSFLMAAANGVDDATPLTYGGGAVYVPQGGSVRIEGNDHVEFRNNWITSGDTYRLMGLCVEGDELVLAAGAGQDITFYDALYAKSANGALQVSFNADYRDKGNVLRKATGDIVFSGKYAEQDLRALKRYYTQEELEASLTTEVYGTTNLYGGRLRIEDGAVYKGNGINVAAGSKATLRLANGTLNQVDCAVTLASGTTLELQGVNDITAAALDMRSGSMLSFVVGSENLNASCLFLDGDLTRGGRVTLNLANAGTMKEGQEYRLLTLADGDTPATWNWNYITLSGLDAARDDFRWQDGTLYFQYTRVPADVDFPAGGTWANGVDPYRDGDRVTFTNCGTITVSGTVNPGGMTVQGIGSTTWSGSGTVAGEAGLTKTGNGTLAINTANTYTGGTTVSAGTLRAANKAALGTGAVQLSGGTLEIAVAGIANTIAASGNSAITVAAGTTHALTGAISNTGTLTLKGAFDASALKLTQGGNTRVDVDGDTGASGFAMNGGCSVTIVTGGTTRNGGATIIHSGLTGDAVLTLGSDGKATTSGSGVDYTTYLLTGRDSAGLEAIAKMAGKKLQLIDMQGGTLDIVSAKGATLGKGVALNMEGGTVDGRLMIGSGSTLRYSDGSFTEAPELKGGTIDFGSSAEVTVSGSSAETYAAGLDFIASGKGTLQTSADITLAGGTLTVTALKGYRGKFLVEGGTLKLSTGKLAVDNDIIVKGAAVLNNGSTHSGDITVNGDLLKGTAIKLIDKNQRITLDDGVISGTISGTGRVDIDGEVDITQGKLTAEQVYLNGTLSHAKGWTLAKGQTLTLGGGRVAGKLVVGTGSTLDFNGRTLAEAPELKGGTLDMGSTSSISLTGSKASVTLGGQDVYVTSKGIVYTNKALEVTGGTVTLTALDRYSGNLVAEGGATLKISTGKLAVDNDIIVKGAAVLNNGSTHSGNITVNGDLLKGTAIKLIDKNQRITLDDGVISGTISGTGRVDIDGEVDLTPGKITAEQVYLSGTLCHAKGWTLAKGQTLTLGGGRVAGKLVVGTGSTLDFNDRTLAEAPELKGGTLDMGSTSSISLTGSKATVTLGEQDVYVTSKGTILTDDNLEVTGGTVTLTALEGYEGVLVAEGGTLKISTGKKTVDNAIRIEGAAVLNNGSTHSGNITVNGDLLKGSAVKLTSASQCITLGDGIMAGTISGTGRVDIAGEVDITQGKLTATDIHLRGTLSHAKGWALAKGQTLTLEGGWVAGKLTVGTGSVLDFNGYTLAEAPELKGGTLAMGGTSSISLTGSKASVTLGGQDVYVTSKGTILTDDDLEVAGGTVTLTAVDEGYKGKLVAEGGTLKISTGKKPVDNDIIVNGSAVLNNGSTHSGNITVNGDLLKGTAVKLIDKGQRVTLNGGAVNGTVSGTGRVDVNGSVDFTQGKLTAEQIFVNSGGRLANSKAWALAKGQTLAFAGGGMEVGAKGLSTAAGSTLRLQQAGTLNGSLTLGGGELVYCGNSPLTVTGTLTLSKATTLTMTGDLVKGATYTLFKCSNIVTSKAFDAATFFNNPDVEVNVTSTAITATYNGRTVHSFTLSSPSRTTEPEETEEAAGEDQPMLYALATATTPAGAPAMAGEELPIEEEAADEAPQEGAVPLAAAEPQQQPQAAVADAMVQADWGAANAGRAFSGTLRGRHQSLRAIGTGRTAVWADAILSHTRQSSVHGHAGADSNLYGAALGVEFNAGEHAAAGLALGHTWNRVETFLPGRVKQDTQHAGAFGRARMLRCGAHSLWLEGSAAYGKTESRGTLGGDARERWTQDGATLSVHVNDAVQVGESTALNLFAGLEYLATDSGRIGPVHTGSVQNLRAELGGGITHTAGRGMVFAEAALTGDLVRHNPEATIGGKYSGANPGRIGAGITVGGAYTLDERWSLNATYTFQGAKHNNSHSVDLGTTCRF